MEPELDVLILTTEPGTARTLRRWLAEGPRPARSAPNPPAAGEPGDPPLDIVVIAPCDWREMGRWASPLEVNITASRWLLFADPRIAGLFLDLLQTPPHCTILGATARRREFEAAFGSLLAGQPQCDPDAFRSRINAALTLPDGRKADEPSPRELQGACACSLGLTNHEIAQVLGITEGTVKQELSHLFRKLGRESRRQVAEALDNAIVTATAAP